jgi:thiamine-phosphate pyrophosphorylase
MISRKRLLLNSRLYLVLDKDSCWQGNAIGIFRKVNKLGIDLVQLRENAASDLDFLKDAKIIKRLCSKRTIFLINNRADIAKLVDADGLHLGQSDLPITEARRILGENKIIGMSCHNLTQAKDAEVQGADYISIGPVFRTKIKPTLKPISLKLIMTIEQRIKIPFFAIGGIRHSNLGRVISGGAKRVALCRAICRAQDVEKATRRLRALIDDYIDYHTPFCYAASLHSRKVRD